MSDAGNSGSTQPKVERVIDSYGLDGLADDIERRWVGDGTESQSTRELATYFNKRVLAAAIDDSSVALVTEDVGDIYAALTDDTADHDTTLIESRLRRGGVDISDVRDDFISHQTIYRYLTEIRGAERASPSESERLENGSERIQRLQGRTTAVTEQTIDSLATNDIVSIGSFDVLTDVQVFCQDCGRSYDVTTFLERKHCDCAQQTDGEEDAAE
jgi:hypothetical protein